MIFVNHEEIEKVEFVSPNICYAISNVKLLTSLVCQKNDIGHQFFSKKKQADITKPG